MASKEIIMGLCVLALGITHGIIWDIEWIVFIQWQVSGLFFCFFLLLPLHNCNCSWGFSRKATFGSKAIFVLKITGNVWVVTAIVYAEVEPTGTVHPLVQQLIPCQFHPFYHSYLSCLILIVKATWFIAGVSTHGMSGLFSFTYCLNEMRSPWLNDIAVFFIYV